MIKIHGRMSPPDFVDQARRCLYCGQVLAPGEIAITHGYHWAKKPTDVHYHTTLIPERKPGYQLTLGESLREETREMIDRQGPGLRNAKSEEGRNPS